MILVNTESVPGYRVIRTFGMVQGCTIRTKHVGRDLMAGLKSIVGGELRGYTEMITEARRQATERMMADAKRLGANAVVNVRYTTSSVAAGASEIFVWGTAVEVIPEN